ncbi:hypothetical protein [Streptomyces sp. NPDC056628]|uniref:hypothetical protein n=1 Tax=Streptomyces sp. NPDC056628 TaxID=3345882 RepID=UPI00369F92ED
MNTADGSPRHREQARGLATDTRAETERSGMIRSEIAAHSFLERILLRHGDVTTAERHTRTALRMVSDMAGLIMDDAVKRRFRTAVALNRPTRAGTELLP